MWARLPNVWINSDNLQPRINHCGDARVCQVSTQQRIKKSAWFWPPSRNHFAISAHLPRRGAQRCDKQQPLVLLPLGTLKDAFCTLLSKIITLAPRSERDAACAARERDALAMLCPEMIWHLQSPRTEQGFGKYPGYNLRFCRWSESARVF